MNQFGHNLARADFRPLQVADGLQNLVDTVGIEPLPGSLIAPLRYCFSTLPLN